jgi:hypothetical protein
MAGRHVVMSENTARNCGAIRAPAHGWPPPCRAALGEPGAPGDGRGWRTVMPDTSRTVAVRLGSVIPPSRRPRRRPACVSVGPFPVETGIAHGRLVRLLLPGAHPGDSGPASAPLRRGRLTQSDSLRNGYGGARLREVVESASRASLLSVAAESLRSRRDGDGGWPPLSLLRWPVRQPESRGTQPEGRRGLTRAGPPGVNRPGRVVAWP